MDKSRQASVELEASVGKPAHPEPVPKPRNREGCAERASGVKYLGVHHGSAYPGCPLCGCCRPASGHSVRGDQCVAEDLITSRIRLRGDQCLASSHPELGEYKRNVCSCLYVLHFFLSAVSLGFLVYSTEVGCEERLGVLVYSNSLRTVMARGVYSI